ncbi:MAG: methylenetetrahydrofolate--tRNA-(uracil(54)-C(5))-methyltransferase (FADH(2)-oxidizing) TrmFO [Rhodospirillales bacterium]|nr:methylenetetrahydrofolate--tRNA-(uracil(54)-C(5))-methyltransferase (FADH(2)-oxidizing) TrmFO [Rhodospirillales bacterium]
MSSTPPSPVHVVGGGLAGCEAAWQLAVAGVPVVLHEMRPSRMTPAHQTGDLAELVCSNSFRSDDAEASAIGLLHAEMRCARSLIIATADDHRVPAGSALAVDRTGFSAAVAAAIAGHPLIEVRREEVVADPPTDWENIIIATGPLTSAPLADWLRALTGEDALAFFDAIAPIVYHDSIDFTKAWRQSRYDKGNGDDYVNCPLSRVEYEAFIAALRTAETTPLRDWERETPYFEGCLPIEVMAERGPQTLAFGPMKPVGLRNPHDDNQRPYAVVQLRQDNALGSLYNIVGFQTKLKHGEQVRLFRTIPGLEHAEFARLGGLHRNTFVNARKVLDETLRLRARPTVRLAGQITGCEGYVESAAIGLLAGRFTAAERRGSPPQRPPATTALGALLRHLTDHATSETFQPMNVNFGLFPPLNFDAALKLRPRGAERKRALTARARDDLGAWIGEEEEVGLSGQARGTGASSPGS